MGLTSAVDPVGRPKHAILLGHLGHLPLGREILPLALAGLELLVRLDLARHLGRPGRPIADAAGLASRLIGQGRVDVGRGRDDARVGRGRCGGGGGRGRVVGRRSIGLAFLGIVVVAVVVRDRPQVLGRQRLGRAVALERDHVHGRRGRAGDGGDAGRVEGVIARQPLGQYRIVDDVGRRRRRGLLDGALRARRSAVAGLVGRMVLARPFLLGGWWWW